MKISQWFKKVSLSVQDPDVEQLAFFLQVLAHGARSDGDINESEILALHRVCLYMCGGDADKSKKMMEFADWPKNPEEHKHRITQPHWKKQDVAWNLLRDSLSVLLADGAINEKEFEWLNRFWRAFEIENDAYLVNASFFIGREDDSAFNREFRDLITPVLMDGDLSKMMVSDVDKIWRWMHEMLPGEVVVCPFCIERNVLPQKAEFFRARCQKCNAYLALTNAQGEARSTIFEQPLPLPESKATLN